MNNLFVPYEIALKLKEKGFDEECLGLYFEDESFSYDGEMYTLPTKNSNRQLGDIWFAAPLYDQVIDWFIEKHNIEIDTIRYTYSGGKFQGKKYMWYVDEYDPHYNEEREAENADWIVNHREAQGYDFTSRKEALNVGILKAIELVKQKK